MDDRLKRVKGEGRGLLAICKIACFVCYCLVNIKSGPNTTIVFVLSCATDLINTFSLSTYQLKFTGCKVSK